MSKAKMAKAEKDRELRKKEAEEKKAKEDEEKKRKKEEKAAKKAADGSKSEEKSSEDGEEDTEGKCRLCKDKANVVIVSEKARMEIIKLLVFLLI